MGIMGSLISVMEWAIEWVIEWAVLALASDTIAIWIVRGMFRSVECDNALLENIHDGIYRVEERNNIVTMWVVALSMAIIIGYIVFKLDLNGVVAAAKAGIVITTFIIADVAMRYVSVTRKLHIHKRDAEKIKESEEDACSGQ